MLATLLQTSAAASAAAIVMLIVFLGTKKIKLPELLFILYPLKFAILGLSGGNIAINVIIDIMGIAGLLAATTEIWLSPRLKFNEYTILVASFIILLISEAVAIVQGESSLMTFLSTIRLAGFPLLMLIILGKYLECNPHRLAKVIELLIVGIATSSMVALVNYFFTVYDWSGIQGFAPYLHYLGDGKFLDGRFLFGNYLPRLNLFQGGASGSLAGLLPLYTLILFNDRRFLKNKVLVFLAVLTCCLLTMSYTMFLAFLIVWLILSSRKEHQIVLALTLCFLIGTLGILTNAGSQFGAFILGYLLNIGSSVFDGLTDALNLSDFLWGGPNSITSSFGHHENEILGKTDNGIFRAYFDHGIFFFIALVGLLISIGKKLIQQRSQYVNAIGLSFIVVLLLSIHGLVIFKPIVTLMLATVMAMANLQTRGEQ